MVRIREKHSNYTKAICYDVAKDGRRRRRMEI